MICSHCEKGRLKRRHEPYHYDESGLSDVFLENVEWYKCSLCSYTEAVIPRIGQLHRCIAWRLLTKRQTLSGDEIVFLRKRLGLSQGRFAELLGVKQPMLNRWERGRQQPVNANDRLIRIMYLVCSKDDEYTRSAARKLKRIILSVLAGPAGARQQTSKPLLFDPSRCSAEKEIERSLEEWGPVRKAQQGRIRSLRR